VLLNGRNYKEWTKNRLIYVNVSRYYVCATILVANLLIIVLSHIRHPSVIPAEQHLTNPPSIDNTWKIQSAIAGVTTE